MENSNACIPVSIQLDITTENSDDLRKKIVDQINYLIVHDFEKLISILYRMDVSEPKIEVLLKKFPEKDAAEIIAALMIEREEEKIRSREMYKREAKVEDENELW